MGRDSKNSIFFISFTSQMFPRRTFFKKCFLGLMQEMLRNERIPFPLFLQHHPERLFPLTRRPSLRVPARPRRANGPSAGKGTRRGYPWSGRGYWAETRLCRVLIPGWWPFMSGSWTSAPAPWCRPAGSCLPLTASSASTIVCSFALFVDS